jgi:hypothetical protein
VEVTGTTTVEVPVATRDSSEVELTDVAERVVGATEADPDYNIGSVLDLSGGVWDSREQRKFHLNR